MGTLEQAMADPLSMTDEDMARMLESEQGEDGAPPGGEKSEDRKEEPKAEEPKDPDDPDQTQPEVLTKDGKHSIPYSVLERQRERAAQAEQARIAAEELATQTKAQAEMLQRQLAEQQEQIKALQAERAGGEKAPAFEGIDPEAIAALKEEAPELAKILEGQSALIAALKQQNAEQAARFEAFSNSVQERTRADGAKRVEDVIANNPKLVYLRSEDPEAYNEVVDMDGWLLSQPKYKGMGLADRISKALALYEAANGEVKLPGNAKRAAKQPSEPAEKEPSVPNTLSDMAGGSLPEKGVAEQLASLSARELTERFEKMEPADIDKLLARMSL